MEKFEIIGGKKMAGVIEVRGSKNATTPILAATLLTKEECLISNIPLIEDVFRMLEILESILLASQMPKKEKLPVLEKTSLQLNSFRIFVRLAKEVKAIDNKKYVLLQENTDEVGRMLGGWIRSTRSD